MRRQKGFSPHEAAKFCPGLSFDATPEVGVCSVTNVNSQCRVCAMGDTISAQKSFPIYTPADREEGN